MKKLLAVLLLLVPAVSFAAPSPLGLALRLEHVWTERVEDPYHESDDTTDLEGTLAPSLYVAENVYLIGRGTYKFGAERSEWALGVEYRFGTYTAERKRR